MIAAALAASLVGAALAPGWLEVTGDATCPTPAEVAARLTELPSAAAPRPPDAGDARAARVIVTRNGPALRLVLLGPNANELAARELPGDGACEDLAAAAAVVVSSWQADLDPDLAPSVALPARPPPPPAPPVVARAAPTPPAPPHLLELGLGLVVSEVDGAFAPGAILEGSLGRGLLGLDASVLGTTTRTASVAGFPGVASWTRVTLAAGPALQQSQGNVRSNLHLQALLGVLHVRGVNITDPGSDTTAELGVAVGGRLSLVTGTSAAWLGFDVLGWPGEQRLLITNDPSQGRLSRLELVGSLGLSLGRFP
jgi:hypothetical protein